MPALPVSSSASLPAIAALPSVAIRRHGLYLAAMVAYFRATQAAKTPRPAPVQIPGPRSSAAAVHLSTQPQNFFSS
jgi:hypothetical protein